MESKGYTPDEMEVWIPLIYPYRNELDERYIEAILWRKSRDKRSESIRLLSKYSKSYRDNRIEKLEREVLDRKEDLK